MWFPLLVLALFYKTYGVHMIRSTHKTGSLVIWQMNSAKFKEKSGGNRNKGVNVRNTHYHWVEKSSPLWTIKWNKAESHGFAFQMTWNYFLLLLSIQFISLLLTNLLRFKWSSPSNVPSCLVLFQGSSTGSGPLFRCPNICRQANPLPWGTLSFSLSPLL